MTKSLNTAFAVVLLLWFCGWELLLLRFPALCFRLLAWGGKPTPRNLKAARVVGYMGIFFGGLLLLGIGVGLVSLR